MFKCCDFSKTFSDNLMSYKINSLIFSNWIRIQLICDKKWKSSKAVTADLKIWIDILKFLFSPLFEQHNKNNLLFQFTDATLPLKIASIYFAFLFSDRFIVLAFCLAGRDFQKLFIYEKTKSSIFIRPWFRKYRITILIWKLPSFVQ